MEKHFFLPSAFPGLVHALVGIWSGLPGCCWRLGFAGSCRHRGAILAVFVSGLGMQKAEAG